MNKSVVTGDIPEHTPSHLQHLITNAFLYSSADQRQNYLQQDQRHICLSL